MKSCGADDMEASGVILWEETGRVREISGKTDYIGCTHTAPPKPLVLDYTRNDKTSESVVMKIGECLFHVL